MIVLVFRRGYSVIIFVTVFVTENTQIDIATFYFFEVNLVGTTILGRKILEKKNLGYKTSQDSITKEKKPLNPTEDVGTLAERC